MSALFGRGELTPRGRWLAIVTASIVMQFSYWPAIFALAASHADEPVPLDLALFGLTFVPRVFIVLAFLSRHPRAPGAVLKAMGLFLLVGAPVVLVNPLVGFAAGFGAGGIAALRRPEDAPLRPRVIALTATCVYLLGLVLVGLTDLAIMSAAAVPLAVLGIADEVTVGRAAQGAERP
jgi:hypothetical protein